MHVKLATPLLDFYGDNVQSEHDLHVLANRAINVKVDYDIANRVCAVQSKADWVVLDPIVDASSMSSGEGDEVDDIEEFVEWHPNLDGGLVIEEDWTVIGPVPDGGGEYIE